MGRSGRRKDEAPLGYVTVREAAEMLDVSETAVRQREKRGTLPTIEDLHTQSGKEPRYYIPLEAMERAVAEKEALEEAPAQLPEVRIVLHHPKRPQTVRVETGPEGVEVHLDG